MLVAHIQIFVAKNTIRNDSGNSLALFQIVTIFRQHAILHSRRMRRRNQTIAIRISFLGHKRIVIVARWMTFWKIQTLKHMELIVNLSGLFRDESHAIKDLRNALNFSAKRMNRALFARQKFRLGRIYIHRRRNVNRFQVNFFQLFQPRSNSLFNSLLQLINSLAKRTTLNWR